MSDDTLAQVANLLSRGSRPNALALSLLGQNVEIITRPGKPVTALTPMVTNTKAPIKNVQVTPEPQQVIKPVKAARSSKKAKKDLPHALLWVSHGGPGRKGSWTNDSLKIVGVYGSKDAAERKKDNLMQGLAERPDVIIGKAPGRFLSMSNLLEIDLVVRPCEEFEVENN